MRQIKFRAWDTIDKRMRYENDVEGIKEYPTLLAIGFHGLPICITPDSIKANEIVGWNRDHNLILMQYTGLTDRNGKEIYEGDIVQGAHRANEDWVQLQEVKFSKGCFMFGNWNAHEYFNKHTYIEIISNIYSNPEQVTA